MKLLHAILPTLFAALTVSCGGGGGGGGGSTSPGSSAPTALSYAADDVIYLKGVRIADNVPSVSGGSASWSASPALPGGLSLSSSGAITGTPTAEAAATTYTITASNSAGSTSTTVELAVALPPRFGFAANQIDNTISLYTIDGETGQAQPNGFFGTTLTQVAPQRVVTHPNGQWVYTPNLGNPGAVSPNISAYTIDPASGRIFAGTPAGTGTGPFDMVISPDGRHAYVAAEGSDSIWEYSIQPQSGLLSLLRAPITHGTRPTSIVFHPGGQFAYVAYNGTQRVVVYDVNVANGQLTERTTLDLGLRPRFLAIDPEGDRLYVTDDQFRLLVQYSIDDATGDLTNLRNRPIGNPVNAIEMHPTGRWILAAREDGTVRAWSISPTDGALAVTTGSAPAGTEPVDIAFDAGGRFAYVTSRGDNEVAVLEVDLGTGELSPSSIARTRATPGGFATAAGQNPASPQGKFLYTANEGSDTVTPYRVNASTGQLTPIAVPPVLTAEGPRSVAADPLGRFLYVVNAVDRSVSTYTIDSITGAPTPVGMPLVFSGNGLPRAITIDGSGRFAFVSNAGGAVEAFWVDQGTGELQFVASTPSDGSNPDAIAVDPTGQFIYVANLDSGDVTAIRFDQGRLAGGQAALWVVSKATITVGAVRHIAFSPAGDRAYLSIPGVADQILAMNIDPDSGALSIAASGAADGNDPVASAFHPSGAWAYGALQGGTGAVAEYDVNDVGNVVKRLELPIGMGPVDLAVDPSGSFLYVANEAGEDISVFAINATTGALTSTGAFSTDQAPQDLELVTGL